MHIKESILVLLLSIITATALLYLTKPSLIPTFIKDIIYTYNFKQYDVIIIGSGLAGLSAAYEASKNENLNIAVIEGNAGFGGNSAKATSGINILKSVIQEKEGINDSQELFFNDTYFSGKKLGNKSIIEKAVNLSHYLYSYYKDIGVELNELGILGGHSVARTHRPDKGTVGYVLVSTLYEKLKYKKNVKFLFNTTALDLIPSASAEGVSVIGIVISSSPLSLLETKSIVLASGGFAHDFGTPDSLLKEYAPNILKFPTTNGNWTKGLGIKMARRINVKLTGMKEIQIHPTGFVDVNNRFEKNKILGPELLRGVGGILVNQKGKRFCNELGPRDYVTKEIIKNCLKQENDNIEQYEAIIVLTEDMIKKFGENIYFYIKKGLLKEYNNLKDMSMKLNIEYDNLEKTINQYSYYSILGNDPFNKKVYPGNFTFDTKIYAGIVTPSIHYTMGGILVDTDMRAILTSGVPVDGLFAAGEVTGGLHGGNRLGGNSLMECSVYGKVAGKGAAEYAMKKKNISKK